MQPVSDGEQTAVHHTPDLSEELAELRGESLRVVTFVGSIAAYLWIVWLLWHLAQNGNRPVPTTMWLGAAILAGGLIGSSELSERRRPAARHCLSWTILGATACLVLAYPTPATIYLLILPVTFAAGLLSFRGMLLVSITAAALAMANNPARGEAAAQPIELILPIIIIGLVAFSSWLSVRSLNTALTWALQGYERARNKEQIARQREGELRRTLKVLDQTTYGLERANQMLALAHDQAEEASRLKQQFVQTVSHELRTPLNLIAGFIESMTESPEYYGSPLPPAYQRDLNIMYRNARHLQTLINDVLDLSRIEAAQMSLVPEETALAVLVQEALNTARSLVESHGLTLKSEIQPDLPHLWLDPTRIRQVLFNLLNNASRFTERGGITVRVYSSGDEVIFAVADTGVGIAPSDVSRLFQDFQQVDGSTRRRHGGVGLGLAISKRFVEMHGGRIWVESQPGLGSTFYFALPTQRTFLGTIPDGRAKESVHLMAANGSNGYILIVVTRSPSAASLLSRYVHGCRTIIVQDMEQAERTACQVIPQVVIIDTHCVSLQEDELAELGRRWELPHTYFLSCQLPGEDQLRQQLAVDGYLSKPVSRQSLLDALRPLGEDVDRVLVVDDDPDFALLLSRILDSSDRRYQTMCAYSGREALALLERFQPDLILLDIGLPDINGKEVAIRLSAASGGRRPLIVIVSGQEELDHLETVRGALQIAKYDGLMPAEIVQWGQCALDMACRMQTETPGVTDVSAATDANRQPSIAHLPVTPVP